MNTPETIRDERDRRWHEIMKANDAVPLVMLGAKPTGHLHVCHKDGMTNEQIREVLRVALDAMDDIAE